MVKNTIKKKSEALLRKVKIKTKEISDSMDKLFMKILGSLAAATLVGSILVGLDFWLHIPILISIILFGTILLVFLLILIFVEKRKGQNRK